MDTEDGANVVDKHKENLNTMKKIMSALLGLSLVLGTATVTFAQQDTTKKKTHKKKSKKSTTSTHRSNL